MKGDESIIYFPPGDMLADVFTKPLQSSLFGLRITHVEFNRTENRRVQLS